YLLCGDWHRADDLAQNAFVSVHRHWSRIKDKTAVDAYLRRTLVRAAIDESRRGARREKPTEVLAESAEPDARIEALGTRQLLLKALQSVPLRQRAALVLRFFEDLSVPETARALRCSEGTVKSQTARGLGALRAALGADLADLAGEKADSDEEVSG
ncbi:MAG: SigE family RNA polymerase sigma factor, partial [Sciscionella sp.]